jgi:protein-tyrosine phosphatase
MLNFIKKIDQDQNQKIHVHCAAGKGRTGIFLVIYDIYKNYNNSSLEEIFDRQAKLGSANLNNLKYENEWSDQEKQNIILLKNFYYQLKHN